MRAVSLLAVLGAAAGVVADGTDGAVTGPVTGAQGNASVVEDNPPGVVYQATLPDTAFTKSVFPKGGNIKGSISAVANSNGIGVRFQVRFSNLPEGGPFLYHIHDQPVSSDGNCTKTLAHLDPFIRGEDPACATSNATTPAEALSQTCQVGDLSGKHGKITRDALGNYAADYLDLFASTKPGIGAFFGNRSFVVHLPNKTRITCANFAVTAGNASLAAPSPSSSLAASATSLSGASTTAGSPLAPTGSPSPTFASVSGVATVETTVWAIGTAWLFTAIMVML